MLRQLLRFRFQYKKNNVAEMKSDQPKFVFGSL